MITHNEELARTMSARLSVYQLLARLWSAEVDEPLWQALSAQEFPSLPDTPELDRAWKSLEDSIKQTDLEGLHVLAADYAMLCRGVNPVKGADPYESVHRNPMRLMMQDEWEAVLRFYREMGFSRSETAVEPEDHLGIELECMTHLCERYVAAFENEDEATCQQVLAWQQKLLGDHLLKWVPSFVREVLKVADTEFYRALATITQEYLILDSEFLLQL